MDKSLVDQAMAEGQKWLDALKLDGSSTIPAIQKVLEERVFEGKPVEAFVAKNPDEAVQIIEDYIAKIDDPEKKAECEAVARESCNCIWDYYLMAFYESACAVLPDKEFEGAEFIYQSMFPGFQNGLGFVITLGDVLIGVCLPELHRDDQFRLHRQDGPAVVWGEKYYFWHGTQLPDPSWIEDTDNVDPSLCLTHGNIEERRCLCEIMGWEKVLSKLEAKVIDEDVEEYNSIVLRARYKNLSQEKIAKYMETPEGVAKIFKTVVTKTPRQLLETDLPGSGKERFLRVICGTGRPFCLPVGRDVATALEAAASTYGVSPEEYKPEARA